MKSKKNLIRSTRYVCGALLLTGFCLLGACGTDNKKEDSNMVNKESSTTATENKETTTTESTLLSDTSDTSATNPDYGTGGNQSATEDSHPVKDAVEDAGNSVNDVMDGVGNGISDTMDGIGNGVKDLTDQTP